MTGWRTSKRTTAERGYGARWHRMAKRFLAEPENALCRMCAREGQTVAAQVVDRIVPHQGDPALFWDRTNWQGLCKSHHSQDKQAEEQGWRRRQTIGPDGWPIG